MGQDIRREHFWDGLRAFLMLLGVPYHVALSYQTGQDFIVHSGEGLRGAREFADAIHLFRMPAFFVIAGYFALLLLARREPAVWLKGRFQRLGLPFLTCLLTLVPAMNLVCELSNMPWHEALVSWRHNLLTSGGYWMRHLWFIVVLLYFCSVTAWLAARFPSVRHGHVPARFDDWAARHLAMALLGLALVVGGWEALAVEAFYKVGLATMLPQQILRLDETIMYGPWFVLGGLLVRSRRTMEQVGRFSLPLALVAVGGTAAWLLVHNDVAPMIERFIGTIAAMACTQVLIAGARLSLDRPVPAVRRLTDASFLIYLFHLPLIVLFVWLGHWVPVPTIVKAVAIMGLSLWLSYVIARGIGRVPGMALLFDGIVRRTGDRSAPQPA